ncbi:putative 22kda glyco protein [Phaeoacremonium minimum UCRPA7]|uniref:Putative 22kda glyco protein n=1 Tax=Phaeoacremonium minimum (strain UCR-PA7) TaxID=1286976 RepID=R8BHJ7_PHAM7|nr:putative 22kda glyco protein [Phaeoacremonium minimum UCRPA7]EON98781.1 putative 22kda glyco protein [Phaeoacremonium minimum UCRPA7]
MKFTSALTTLFLTAASASPLKPRAIPPFNVTDFSAGTVPHSVQNYYGFNVQTSPGSGFAKCTANIQAYQAMMSVPVTACDSAGVYFNFTITGGQGAELDVWWRFTGHGELKGTYQIPEDQLPFEGEGTGVHQVYSGPVNFTITDVVEEAPTDNMA